MKKSICFLTILCGLMFVQCVFAGTEPNQNEEYNLELKISCPAKNLQVGDEIPIIFTITNNGEREYQYEVPNYDRSGRLLEYQLFAKDKNGKMVPDPRKDIELGLGGGLGAGEAVINKGQSFNHIIALNRWALINMPGKYTVTAIYTYGIEDKDAVKIPDIRMMKTIEVKSEPIVIEIKSRSSRQMGRYIDSLQKELKELQKSNKLEVQKKREETILKLDYTCDERIIPTLIDLIYLNQHNNDVFWAMEGFRCYLPKTTKIKNQIVNTVKIRGLSDGMGEILKALNCDETTFTELIKKSLESDNPNNIAEASIAAQEHLSDEIMPLLISVAKGEKQKGKNYQVPEIARERAIYAIARNRTDEVVAALNELINDSNKVISRTARDAVQHAYRQHPVYPEKTDEEYTAILIPIATNPHHPRCVSFIYEIFKTRTKDGVDAIKKLVENPQLNIPIAETDSGVKAIRDNLRNPDKNFRDLTSDLIKNLIKTYSSQPFRNDDFPVELREDPIVRKQKMIEQIKSWQN